MPTANLYLWKSSGTADDEVSIGDVIVDPSGDRKFLEHLTLHIDTLLTLFGIEVYRRIEGLQADDDPVPLTLTIDVGEATRGVAQAPSATQRRPAGPSKQDRRA